ncbi:uncharacterized protein LOC125779058 [Bactrocera dorsalis]|uniref:Uncharacterized protein LOC125779058 n=1 Tax=Bactrocera dorsalis TaxID=27457 RepID=A0ABM3K1V4_BACDO|nr:uncharacterized protein LOC125779058 [Bactrocera dorsalis]
MDIFSSDENSYAPCTLDAIETLSIFKSWELNDDICSILVDYGVTSTIILTKMDWEDIDCLFEKLPTKLRNYYEKKCWLQNNCTPWEQVIDYWKETSGQRIMDIHNASSLSCIFSEWPRYKDFRGYELVEIDFATLYSGKGNMLFLKLEKFYKEILKIFDRDIKDRVSRELFLKYLHIDNVSNECKYCISTILLHALPLRLNKDKKPTIADAQTDFVTLGATRNDIQPTIIELKNQFAVRKEKLQPRIIVVGSDWSSISEFYVFCDGLQWKCTTYMKCVDCIIKLSYVYKIEYSQRSKQVWAFLEQYFFELKSEEFSSVANLLSKLN